MADQLYGRLRHLREYLFAGRHKFSSVESVRELIRKEKLLVKVMEELKVRKKELKAEPRYD